MTAPGVEPSMPEVEPTARWAFHVLLAGAGIAAALLLRLPLLALLVAPSALLVALAVVWRPGSSPRVSVAVTDDHLVTGDEFRATVTVDGLPFDGGTVEVAIAGPLVADGPTSWAVAPVGGRSVECEVALVARRWGVGTVGPVAVHWRSPGGLVGATVHADEAVDVRVLPRTPAARALVRPRATHPAHGAQRSSDSGEGTEFAELRPFVAGDRARDVDARVSARRGAPWVVTRHPDRRTDIVLLLDANDPTALDDVLEGARAVARGHLREMDRVGVTTMSGVLRWLPPGDGARHEHRIAAALVDTRVAASWVRPAVEALPPRVLPPGALVLGITAGTDPRLAEAAVELRARGWDVAMLVLDPSPGADTDPVDRAARRLEALRRRAVRDRLRRQGVAAVAWDPTTPVDAALVRLRAWRAARTGAARTRTAGRGVASAGAARTGPARSRAGR